MTTGASGRQREPLSTAKKARGVELLALGEPVDRVAEACGVTPKTVENWRSEFAGVILAAASHRLDGVAETVVDTSAKARTKIASRLEAAADALVELLDYEDGDAERSGAPAAKVRLDAAKHVLALGGLVAVTKNEHTGKDGGAIETTVVRFPVNKLGDT